MSRDLVFRAALAIRKGIHELNAARAARGEFILAYGIGIHLGPAIFGPIGNRQRIDFTAIGPTINLSSRLQSATKDYGVDILGVQNAEGKMMFYDKILEAGVRERDPGLIASAPANLICVCYENGPDEQLELPGAA